MELGYLVVIIVVVCEVVKRAGFLKSKYIPFLAVVLGLTGVVYFDGANFLASASGALVGLATTGAYGAFKGLTKEEY